MQRFIRYAILAAGAGTLFGVSCATTARDALMTGAVDFVSGTTTSTLSNALTALLGG